MKIHDIREMKTEELKHQLDEEQKNLIDLRFQNQLKQLTNTSKLKLVKKDVARIKTVLRERELTERKEMPPEKGAAK
ncbi:MAG TPA: 50S ribosomal protein L29 [Ignavibacteriaceae bacterium]|nr:50S ribosomal protein L29 [Ignavibacteriaceae bacterium]